MSVIVVQRLSARPDRVHELLLASQEYFEAAPISGRIDARVVREAWSSDRFLCVSRWQTRSDYRAHASRLPAWLAGGASGTPAPRYFHPLYSYESMLVTGQAFACIFVEGSTRHANRRRALVLRHVQREVQSAPHLLRYIVADEIDHPENLLLLVETRTVRDFLAGRKAVQAWIAVRLVALGAAVRGFSGHTILEWEQSAAGGRPNPPDTRETAVREEARATRAWNPSLLPSRTGAGGRQRG